jgi:hypothetical protein
MHGERRLTTSGRRRTLDVSLREARHRGRSVTHHLCVLVLIAAGCGRHIRSAPHATARRATPSGSVHAPEAPPSDDTTLRRHLGTLQPRQQVKCAFALRNTSEQSWTVASTSTSCGCTAVTVTPTAIPSGTVAAVTLTYTAPSAVGVARSSAVITLTPRDVPPVHIVTECDVRPPVTVTPDRLVVQCAHRSEPVDIVVTVENHSGTPWRGVSVEPAAELQGLVAFRVHCISTDPVQRCACAGVVPANALPKGRMESYLVVTTDPQVGAPVAVPITLNVVGDVHVSPPEMFFGATRRSARRTVLLYLARRLATSCDRLTVEHDLGGHFMVTCARLKDDGRVWRLDGEYGGPNGAAHRRGRIVVRDGGGSQIAEVPVTGAGT